jgi:hypothetical protein
MPLIRSERLIGYGFAVRKAQAQQADEQGRPLFNGDGSPKQIEMTEIVFIDQSSGAHEVIVSFDENGRRELVDKLTGGVMPADVRALEVVRH